MKNIKKILAMVLVVAALMGFATTAIAAVDFTDADKISTDNREAVTVLAALDVINGYTDGSYKPEGTVTRAEMAKMIATIMNGGEDVNNLYKASCTFEDSKNHWAAGYIAYCATQGIINGRSETVFDPNATVTGVESAKMTLCAIGYSAETEGMVGTAWIGNTLSLAAELGLFRQIVAEPGSAMVREDAAQILFNGLNNNTVKYTGGTNITIAGITFIQGGKLEVMDKTLLQQKYPNVDVKADYYDEWHRPGTKITINGNDIFVMDTPVMVSAKGIETKVIYNLIGKVKGEDLAKNNITVNVHNGGHDKTEAEYGKPIYDAINNMTSKTTAKVGTAGDKVELYWNPVTKVLDVVILWAAPVQITAATYSSTTDKTTYTLDQKVQDTLDAATFIVEGNAKNNKDAVATAYYAIVDSKAKVESVELCTVISGKAEGYTGNFETLYMNGKTYTTEADAVHEGETYTYGDNYTLYLDNAGYVQYFVPVTPTAAADVYAYVIDADSERATFGATKYLAKLLTTYGTVEVVEVSEDAKAKVGEVVTYTVDKNVYTIKTADTVAVGSITTRVPAITTDCYADNKTVFVVDLEKETDKSDYMVYNGISSVPTLASASVKCIVKDGRVVVAFAIDAEVEHTSDVAFSLSMLYKTGSEVKQSFDKVYYNVNAIIEGKVTTIRVEAEAYNALATGVTLFTSATKDGDLYTAITPASTSTTLVKIDSFTKYDSGIVMINSTAQYADTDVPAFVYNTKSGVKTLQTKTIKDLTNSFVGYAVFDAYGTITAIYGTDSI